MKRNILIPLLSLVILCSFGVLLVHADSTGGSTPGATTGGSTPGPTKINNPFNFCGSSGCGVLDLLNTIIDNIVMPIAGVLIVLAFIWTGFKYVMARGNPGEIKKAHEMLRYVIIGSIIVLGAAAITKAISGTIDQFNTLK